MRFYQLFPQTSRRHHAGKLGERAEHQMADPLVPLHIWNLAGAAPRSAFARFVPRGAPADEYPPMQRVNLPADNIEDHPGLRGAVYPYQAVPVAAAYPAHELRDGARPVNRRLAESEFEGLIRAFEQGRLIEDCAQNFLPPRSVGELFIRKRILAQIFHPFKVQIKANGCFGYNHDIISSKDLHRESNSRKENERSNHP